MRLSCPNCGAQYEVPLEVIPTSGRDVQCSNCGHTWFQIHPDEDIELAEEISGSVPDLGWSPEGTEQEEIVARDAAEDPANKVQGDEVQPPEMSFEDDSALQEEDAPQEDDFENTEDEDEFGDAPSEPEPQDRDEGHDSDDDSDDDVSEETDEDGEPDWEDVAADNAAEWSFADDTEESDDSAEPEFSQSLEDSSAEPFDHEAEPETEQDTDHDTVDEDTADGERPAPRAIDPAIADVLRQEAEFETQAREADVKESLEMQQELGLDDRLDDGDQRAAEARNRMLRIRGLTDSEPKSVPELDPAAHQSRRELLPDIEEINSTLRSTDDRNASVGTAGVVPTKARRRNGFRLGILVMLVVAALMLLAYSYNREIAKAYPATEPALTVFMEKTNGARVWLDTLVTGGMLWLNTKAEASGTNVD
ncbi:MJ0042 family finger-like domain-containing protein [Shimia gijangensis]|uniref:MJ0042 family finger-like domain-containing protein n=1 Tax=Shimia gijangensis TaxID=1470563 RepID=A0A1M6FI68_9RHOB|nr:zinc-ribbon domain-containing protein [Shimia gijangensis]SHI97302.1 MJ0042 family finger-like domain-containing protein [Shimia gijangensis]